MKFNGWKFDTFVQKIKAREKTSAPLLKSWNVDRGSSHLRANTFFALLELFHVAPPPKKTTVSLHGVTQNVSQKSSSMQFQSLWDHLKKKKKKFTMAENPNTHPARQNAAKH